MPRNRNFEKQAWPPACQACECPALSPGFVSQNAREGNDNHREAAFPGASRSPMVLSKLNTGGGRRAPGGRRGTSPRTRVPGPEPECPAPPRLRVRALGLRSRWPRRGPGPLALAATGHFAPSGTSAYQRAACARPVARAPGHGGQGLPCVAREAGSPGPRPRRSKPDKVYDTTRH
jgi:hypothetical protein